MLSCCRLCRRGAWFSSPRKGSSPFGFLTKQKASTRRGTSQQPSLRSSCSSPATLDTGPTLLIKLLKGMYLEVWYQSHSDKDKYALLVPVRVTYIGLKQVYSEIVGIFFFHVKWDLTHASSDSTKHQQTGILRCWVFQVFCCWGQSDITWIKSNLMSQ